MSVELRELYKRYNQIGEYRDAFTVPNQHVMMQFYKKAFLTPPVMNKKIIELSMLDTADKMAAFQELKHLSEFIQPKSILMRIDYLGIVAGAIPDSFYLKMGIEPKSIIEISLAITLYYLGLENYAFGNRAITKTQKRNILQSEDFTIALEDICLVRGKTTKDEFNKYMELFSKDANYIKEKDSVGLYRDNNRYFILCVDEFLDYVIIQLESFFLDMATKEERNHYSDSKGAEFEKFVIDIVKLFYGEVYHTVFYVYNEKKMELDAVVRKDDDLLVLECKSGTFNISNIEKDDVLKLKIKNGTKKAFETLGFVTRYLEENGTYSFKCKEDTITGSVKEPICIHVSMYPMDFISSSVHTIFPDYLEENNPILSISLEHLFAMMLDARRNGKDVFQYWKKRKEYIKKYPSMRFDNNELDLYYEIINEEKDTMLSKIRKQGWLDSMDPHGTIMSTFHNQFGQETRPSKMMLMDLDCLKLNGIIQNGKSWYGINKRYLASFADYVRRIE